MGRGVGRKARGVLIGLGSVILIVIGLAAAALGEMEASPPLAPLLLTTSDVPAGFVENPARSGEIGPSVISAMGLNPARASTGGAPGWARDWTAAHGMFEIRTIVFDAFNPGWAVQSEQAAQANMERRGLQPFTVPAIPGAVGESATFGSVQSSVVMFERGSLFFSVGLSTPTQFGARKNLEAVIGLAALELRKEHAHYGGTVSQKFDPSFAAGSLLGGAIGYLLLLGAWAYFRDPLRRDRNRRWWKRRSAAPAAADGAIDVTDAAGKLRRTAVVLFWLQLAAATLVIDAFLPQAFRTRVILVSVGLVLAGALAVYRRMHGRRRGAAARVFAGKRPVRATALFILAIISGLLACVSLLHATLSSGGGPEANAYLVSMACFLAVAGIALRRAHRLSAVTAQKSLERDQRPMVLYLRSFGDDGLRLRSATLGRRSLIERFSPNRFDSFEEIIVRHLSSIGPVVAVNPPGTTLAPLGAARATLPQDDWQGVVDDWMERSALIVIGAPPGTASPGLAWEIEHVTEHDRWANAIVVVPPVPAKQLRERWQNFAAQAPQWVPASELGTDPARVLAMTLRDGAWTTITAETRTEWSYAAAIDARSRLDQPAPATGASPHQEQAALA